MEIVIDGKVCTCEKGEYVLNIARRNGIEIPTLCHHPAIPGQGCCRVCIVEVVERGRSKIVSSCVYPVNGLIEVHTDSEKVVRERAMILALIRERAPESDVVAELAERYHAPTILRFVNEDTTRCVLCGLCVKACRTLGSGAISTILRGTEKRVATPYDEPSTECIGCGSCANICPTGNIEMVQDATTRTIWHRTFELVRCERCGAVLGTRETLEHAAELSGTEVQTLCDDCRKADTAHALNEAWVL